jgi:KDEL-tailed cysteine endopeptidase
VLAYNAQNGDNSHWLAMNSLADLTHDEYKARFGLSRERFSAARERREKNARRHAANGSKPPFKHADVDERRMPLAVDWRATKAVAEVKNQLNCGSCWAFSTTGAVEGVNAIYTGELVSLSEQELVDCDTDQDKGCSGGLMDFAFQFIIDNGGIDEEQDYPYRAEDGVCDAKRRKRRVVSIDGFEDVPPEDEVALKKAVSRQPVSVAIEADQRSFQLYGGGVYDSEDCGDQLDHGVLAVGYGSDAVPVPPPPGADEGSGDAGSEGDASTASGANDPGPLPRHNYWIVKNSWGAGWGEGGFIRIRMGAGPNKKGLCGIASVASYPLKNTPNPPYTPPIPQPPPPPPPAPTPPPPGPDPGPPGPKPDPFAPVVCDEMHACPPDSTCCCLASADDGATECGSWGCCPMPQATCCEDGEHCCPSDLPVCDTAAGRCLPQAGAAGVVGAGARRSAPWATKTPAFVLRQPSEQQLKGLALPAWAPQPRQRQQQRPLIS